MRPHQGRAQEGEPCGAVGGMEKGAGEDEEVEDLLALCERLDVDGAVGDAGLFEGVDDVEEVDASADQDGELPGLGATFGERAGAPLFDDVANGWRR